MRSVIWVLSVLAFSAPWGAYGDFTYDMTTTFAGGVPSGNSEFVSRWFSDPGSAGPLGGLGIAQTPLVDSLATFSRALHGFAPTGGGPSGFVITGSGLTANPITAPEAYGVHTLAHVQGIESEDNDYRQIEVGGAFPSAPGAPVSDPVPEPATLTLLGIGLTGVTFRQSNQKKLI